MAKPKEDNLQNVRHSCAHLLAATILKMYPDAKNAIGPAIENGFYQDFDMGDVKITEEDLPKIEKEMRKTLAAWNTFGIKEVSVEQAKKDFSWNAYKLELIEEFAKVGKTITETHQGKFLDLCKGGHIKNPKKDIGVFKLLSIAGAYWRGDEKNKMLTRIYGTCFATQKELEEYLAMLEEAKKRDHRKLGQEMGLFTFSELVGAGLPLFKPKGATLRNTVYNYSRELNKKALYQETVLPNMNRAELFKVSGHYDKYKDDMFEVHSHYTKDLFYLKPMNCPQHCVLYASESRSYRDLPIRFSDFSVLYRDEKPGELNGLLRFRSFTQDDGHAFIREDQVGEEFDNVWKVVDEALRTYGFKYWIRVSLHDPEHPEKYLGDNSTWKQAESKLRELVKSRKIDSIEAIGEAAIYGPKLDFMAKDSLGREWQISTIQLDLNMPSRFKLEYIDSDGKAKTPMMIHRAIVGSERFIALLIEHHGGKFPLWLSPVQVIVLPISDKNLPYAQKVKEKLDEGGIRVEVDTRSETLQAKIRDAAMQKIPYLLVVGAKEEEGKTVAVRNRDGKDEGTLKIDKFLEKIQKVIANRS